MNIYGQMLALRRENVPFCLAVLIAKSGSAPQVPGAKALFTADGRILGTIGGGCLEMECRRIALESLQTGKAIRREFQLNDDFGWDDGLICGGRVQVLILPDGFEEAFASAADGVRIYGCTEGTVHFVERSECTEETREALLKRVPVLRENIFYEPQIRNERLFVFGAGHVGKAIGKLCSSLHFDVILIDDRQDAMQDADWANASYCMDPEKYAQSLEVEPEDYICLVTRGHRNDSRILRQLIGKNCAYLGMIGSKRKREVIRAEMITQGMCTQEQFDSVHSPMGLDIGAQTVEEIAVSVAAQLIAVRAERRGPSLARCEQRPLTAAGGQ